MESSTRTSRTWVIIACFLGMVTGGIWGIWAFSNPCKLEPTPLTDSSHTQVYRITSLIGQPGESSTVTGSPPPLAHALQHEFPGVIAATRLFSESHKTGRYQDKVFVEKKIFRADEAFFDVFDVHLIQGTSYKALQQPFSVVMTTSSAIKYFGPLPQLGQVLSLDHQAYTLTAILPEPLHASPVQFDMLISMSSHVGMQQNNNWGWNILHTYLRLNEQTSAQYLEARLPQVIEKYARPFLGESYDKWLIRGGTLEYLLQAV